jgi:hypothetical protein
VTFFALAKPRSFKVSKGFYHSYSTGTNLIKSYS